MTHSHVNVWLCVCVSACVQEINCWMVVSKSSLFFLCEATYIWIGRLYYNMNIPKGIFHLIVSMVLIMCLFFLIFSVFTSSNLAKLHRYRICMERLNLLVRRLLFVILGFPYTSCLPLVYINIYILYDLFIG